MKTADICVIVGSDEGEVKKAALARAAEMTPAAAGDFGCEIIDGATDWVDPALRAIAKTIEALCTLPFFGGEKLVWLKNATFLADGVVGRSASVLEGLERLQKVLEQGLPAGVRFLLSAGEADKRRSFYKALGKLAKVEVFDEIDTSRPGWEAQAGKLIREKAKGLGLKIGGEALELFIRRSGAQSATIENELRKLDLYLGKRREISLEDVDTLVPATSASVVFALADALMERDLRASLELVEALLAQGENAVGILIVAIIPTVRNLFLVKDLMERHGVTASGNPFHFGEKLAQLPESATAHLPRKKDGGINVYGLGHAAAHADRYKLPELREALTACLKANVALVTSGLEARTVLTELVVRIAAGRE